METDVKQSKYTMKEIYHADYTMGYTLILLQPNNIFMKPLGYFFHQIYLSKSLINLTIF